MKITIYLLLLFRFIPGYSQLSHIIHFSENRFINEKIDTLELQSILLKKYKPLGENTESLKPYTMMLIQQKYQYLMSGLEYRNWPDASVYLQSVFNNIYKSKGEEINKFRICLLRNTDRNACALEDGTIYINIGYFAELKSECELAVILGHEWAHVALNHNFEAFRSDQIYSNTNSVGNTMTDVGGVVGNIATLILRNKAKNKFSNDLIEGELAADRHSIFACKNSDYSLKGGRDLWLSYLNTQNLNKSSVSYRSSRAFIETHPPTQKRLKLFEEALVEERQKKEFVENEALFYKIRQQAIDETIYLAFKEFDFNKSLELSYLQYLYYPKDKFYLFFIIESIRRLILFDPTMANKYFITSQYNLKPQKNISKPQRIISTTFNEKTASEWVYNYSIFNRQSEIFQNLETKRIRNVELSNDSLFEFITYNDAFDYFTKEAEKVDCDLCRFADILKNRRPLKFVSDKVISSNLDSCYSNIAKSFLRLTEIPSSKRDLIVLQGMNVNHSSGFSGIESPDNIRRNYIKGFNDLINLKFSGEFALLNKMDFNEHLLLPNDCERLDDFFNGISMKLPPLISGDPYIGHVSKKFECQMAMPELSQLLETYNFDRIFFVYAENNLERLFNSETFVVTMLDFKNNKIAKEGKGIKENSSKSKPETIIEVIQNLKKS